jgi:energy-coupling factor transporter ATP-binding protein EcfA2
MIESLHVKRFTVFTDVDLHFGRNLNVFVGENGTGKSHLLKLAYSLVAVGAQGQRESKEAVPSSAFLKGAIARKLLGVFRPDELGRLAQRGPGVRRCEIELHGDEPALDLALSFDTESKTEVSVSKVPTAWLDQPPVFLPTRELLTIYPGFVSVYETTTLPFEEIWRDTCILLGAPLARGPRKPKIEELLEPLETALNGDIVLEPSGKFYLNRSGSNTEMHLVAEGLRKLAMVARLIATGTLADKSYLFWDEPEANLNPKLVKDVARAIVHLSRGGVQVFIATHSLFLLRELYILQAETALDTRCFGLRPVDDGHVELESGATMDDIGSIAALDEEMQQSDRYLAHEAKLGSSDE